MTNCLIFKLKKKKKSDKLEEVLFGV